MLKTLMAAIFAMLWLDSSVAIAEMTTVEKWVCTRDGLTRVVRLYAPAKGEAPCKVFYFKRTSEDPTDAQQEADQNAGNVKPIYYSTGNGGFCVRKMKQFMDDIMDHPWACTKQ